MVAAIKDSPSKHILAATDLSETSNHAVTYAVGLAARMGAALTVAHVLELPVFTDGTVGVDEVVAAAERRAREELGRQVDALRHGGLVIDAACRVGAPAQTVLDMARERGVYLIVLGTHGRKGVERLVLGSVAERILRRSRCPVVVVRWPLPPEDEAS